ncbi:hypothetical protein BD560DRAFT_494601 [Blakeslea trispora]|nr:hypothetical protein BD560DRAFT_494601 [Blakeslea trispora]
MILVTLISRSPCCSSSESGSQARQECKSWYVTYISDFVTLKAVILSTWFTSSGYSFVSNAILLIFEITLQSGQKWSFGIFCLCSGPSGIQDLAYPLLAFWRSGLLVFWFLALVLFGDLVLYCAVNRMILNYFFFIVAIIDIASIVAIVAIAAIISTSATISIIVIIDIIAIIPLECGIVNTTTKLVAVYKRRINLPSPHLSSDVAHLQHQVLKTDKNAVLVCSAYTLVYRFGVASATARLLLFRRTSYSRLGMRSTGFLVLVIFFSNAILLIFESLDHFAIMTKMVFRYFLLMLWSFWFVLTSATTRLLLSEKLGIQDLAYPLLAFWRSGLLVFWSLALMLFGDLVLCCAVNRVFKTWSLLYRSKCKPASIVDPASMDSISGQHYISIVMGSASLRMLEYAVRAYATNPVFFFPLCVYM